MKSLSTAERAAKRPFLCRLFGRRHQGTAVRSGAGPAQQKPSAMLMLPDLIERAIVDMDMVVRQPRVNSRRICIGDAINVTINAAKYESSK